jgi:hypothetical protein
MSSNQNIIPKDCSYKCGVRIYWNISENAYFEVFSNKKHVCPNRSNGKSIAPTNNNTNNSNANRPFYNKKPLFQRPKMSNSLELLTGPITEIQKKYEILSDIITEVGGRTHGSQSHITGPGNIISLVVYFEVPEGKREEVKTKFNNFLMIN